MYQSFWCSVLLSAVAINSAQALSITDVRDDSNNTSSSYFLDQDSHKSSWPYYRHADQDWQWQHAAIAANVDRAMLSISAYDVDYDFPGFIGERDRISVWTGSDWFALGDLAGGNDVWAFSHFDLSPYLGSWAQQQINTGLRVHIDIDTAHEGWYVSLAKSTLAVNGGSLQCDPRPGAPCSEITAVPEADSYSMLLAGLGLLGWLQYRQRRIKFS